MLSSADIGELRNAAKEAMPSTMQLWRGTRTEMPGGGSTVAWSNIGTSVCAIGTSLSRTALVGDQARTEADAVVTFPGDSTLDVRPEDRLVVDGTEYEVQGYAEREDRWQITRRVLVSRV